MPRFDSPMLQFIASSFQIGSVIPSSVVVPQKKGHFNYQEMYSELSSLFACLFVFLSWVRTN